MLVYGIVLWLRADGQLSRRTLSAVMLVRCLFAWTMILGGYGLIPLTSGILEPGVILSGCFSAAMFFFYPWTLLWPERFRWRRVAMVFIPLALMMLAFRVAEALGMEITKLETFGDVVDNIARGDVLFRLAMVAVCHLYPVWAAVVCFCAVRRGHAQSNVLRLYGYGMAGMILVFSIAVIAHPMTGFIVQQIWVILFFTALTWLLVFWRQEKDRVTTEELQSRFTPQSKTPIDIHVELFASLERLMDSQKLYLDPNLTLPQLVSMLKTNRTTLSATIRQAGHQTFADYLSYYRIGEFKHQVKTGSTLTIEELCLSSGFGSRTSFFRTFRQKEGITPREWIKEAGYTIP